MTNMHRKPSGSLYNPRAGRWTAAGELGRHEMGTVVESCDSPEGTSLYSTRGGLEGEAGLDFFKQK